MLCALWVLALFFRVLCGGGDRSKRLRGASGIAIRAPGVGG